MAFSQETSITLRDNPPPPAREVRERMLAFLDRTSMGVGDLAVEVNYSRPAVAHFLRGRYRQIAADDRNVRRALTDYMDAHPEGDVAAPEKLVPFLDTRQTLRAAREAQAKSRLIVIEGPAGTGKTAALRWLWAQDRRENRKQVFFVRVGWGTTGMDLLRKICQVTGAYASGTRLRLLNNAARRLRRMKPSVLLLDDAQNLLEGPHGQRFDGVEQLRSLLDETNQDGFTPATGCILAGHFNFVRALSNGSGKYLEPFLSRVFKTVHLRGTDREELPAVIREFFGCEFSRELLDVVARACSARDRNRGERMAHLAQGEEAFSLRYISKRRVRFLVDLVEELRAIPENAGKPLEAILRKAGQLMLREGKAL